MAAKANTLLLPWAAFIPICKSILLSAHPHHFQPPVSRRLQVSTRQAALLARPELPQLHLAAQVPQGGLGHVLARPVGGPGLGDQVLSAHFQNELGEIPSVGDEVADQHAGLFLDGEREKWQTIHFVSRRKRPVSPGNSEKQQQKYQCRFDSK